MTLLSKTYIADYMNKCRVQYVSDANDARQSGKALIINGFSDVVLTHLINNCLYHLATIQRVWTGCMACVLWGEKVLSDTDETQTNGGNEMKQLIDYTNRNNVTPHIDVTKEDIDKMIAKIREVPCETIEEKCERLNREMKGQVS